MSPQKPMRRAYEQSDEAVRRWLEVDYPALVKRAYRERAEILGPRAPRPLRRGMIVLLPGTR
jgi:hypothetical protein